MSEQDKVREQMQQIAQKNQRDEVLYETELSSRFAVRLAELTGADETIVVRLLGKDFTATGAGAVKYRNALLGRSLKQFKSMDPTAAEGTPERDGEWSDMDPKKADAFINTLKLQEKERLGVAYDTLNGLDEAEREKVKNGLTPTMTT